MLKSILLLLISILATQAFAQNLPSGAAALVNGKTISQTIYDQNLSTNLAQGLKDTPQLRQTVKEELINRELLTQQAEKLGLDKSPQAILQLQQLRENMLAEMLLTENLKKNPIKEEEIKADYKRQTEMIGKSGNAKQYKLSVIVVFTEEQAKGLMSQLNKGASFETLAKERSIDGSKSNGGLVGWVLPSQVNPTIRDVMIKVNKNAIAGPIPTGEGWNIIKVDDVRPFKTPTYDESKNGIIQLLMQQRRAQLIDQLRSTSKIIQ